MLQLLTTPWCAISRRNLLLRAMLTSQATQVAHRCVAGADIIGSARDASIRNGGGELSVMLLEGWGTRS